MAKTDSKSLAATAPASTEIDATKNYGFLDGATALERMKRYKFIKYMPFVGGVPMEAVFGGYGGQRIVADLNKPGRFRRIHTWLLRINDSTTWRVPGSTQINNQLPNYPIGDEILIVQHADKVRTKKGNMANDFDVSEPPSGWLRKATVVLDNLEGDAGLVPLSEAVNPADVLDTTPGAAS